MAAGNDVAAVTANGLEFGYLQAGQPGSPLALCLHGFPDSAYTWRYLLPVLAGQGYHAVAPFLRGYAPTDVPADGCYQVGALVADAVALHEAFGADERAVLIGHDWGAIATYATIAYSSERWRRAVTIAVPPIATVASAFFDYRQIKRSFYIYLFQTPLAEAAVSTRDLAFIEDLWHDWAPGYDSRADAAAAKECIRDPGRLAAAIGYYRALLDPALHLPKYAGQQAAADAGGGSTPVLYLHGSADECVGANLVVTAPQYLPAGSRLQLVDDGSHFLHLQEPRDVADTILAWLSEDRA
jgi:pimeloyl-ACP methyl ester carboxylesterase